MTMKEDSIDQATSARRERLKALRAAKEFANMPDGDGAAGLNDRTKVEHSTEGYEEKKMESVEEYSTEKPFVARRDRLIALRTAKELLSTSEDSSKRIDANSEGSEEAQENKAPNLKFRNYLPHDQHLQEGKLAPVELPKFEEPVSTVSQSSENIEDPFVNIAPKKPNWDLRRDVQKRLDKLERRTQKALYELMLEQEKEKAAMELKNGGNDD